MVMLGVFTFDCARIRTYLRKRVYGGLGRPLALCTATVRRVIRYSRRQGWTAEFRGELSIAQGAYGRYDDQHMWRFWLCGEKPPDGLTCDLPSVMVATAPS